MYSIFWISFLIGAVITETLFRFCTKYFSGCLMCPFSEYWYSSVTHSYLVTRTSATSKTTRDRGAVDAPFWWNWAQEGWICWELSTAYRDATEKEIEISKKCSETSQRRLQKNNAHVRTHFSVRFFYALKIAHTEAACSDDASSDCMSMNSDDRTFIASKTDILKNAK